MLIVVGSIEIPLELEISLVGERSTQVVKSMFLKLQLAPLEYTIWIEGDWKL